MHRGEGNQYNSEVQNTETGLEISIFPPHHLHTRAHTYTYLFVKLDFQWKYSRKETVFGLKNPKLGGLAVS